MKRDDEHRAGFTLVELLLVLFLIGIMANIVIPILRPEGFQMNSALVEVGSTMAAQQRNAVLRQHDVILAFDTAQRRIRVHEDLDNDGDVDSGERTSIMQLQEGVMFGRGGSPARAISGSDLSLTQAQDGIPSLTFHSNGSASERAIIYLTSERASIEDNFPEDGRALEIERATGRVRCFSYDPGHWRERC